MGTFGACSADRSRLLKEGKEDVISAGAIEAAGGPNQPPEGARTGQGLQGVDTWPDLWINGVEGWKKARLWVSRRPF